MLPSNRLGLGLWLESERMLNAKVNNKGIETQRSVVKEEKRQRVDNQPYASFITEMFLRSFPNGSTDASTKTIVVVFTKDHIVVMKQLTNSSS